MATLLEREKALVGVIHLPPLPGSPRAEGCDLDPVLERAVRDARAYASGGAHGVVVENFGDAPYRPGSVGPETIAALSVVAAEVRRAISIPVGVNVLRSDGPGAVAVAAVCDLAFVRVNVHVGAAVTDQGFVTGRAHETMRLRSDLEAPVEVWADVHVKHARDLRGATVADAVRETVERGLADAVILTGPATGVPPDLDVLERARAAAPGVPVIAGSGTTPANVASILPHVDGVIVGTSLKVEQETTAPVDPDRLEEYVRAFRLRS